MGRMTPEYKLADKIVESLNRLDMDPVKVGALLSGVRGEVQNRLYLICMKLLYNWAARYDTGNFPDKEITVLANSKRIVEAFEEAGGVADF